MAWVVASSPGKSSTTGKQGIPSVLQAWNPTESWFSLMAWVVFIEQKPRTFLAPEKIVLIAALKHTSPEMNRSQRYRDLFDQTFLYERVRAGCLVFLWQTTPPGRCRLRYALEGKPKKCPLSKLLLRVVFTTFLTICPSINISYPRSDRMNRCWSKRPKGIRESSEKETLLSWTGSACRNACPSGLVGLPVKHATPLSRYLLGLFPNTICWTLDPLVYAILETHVRCRKRRRTIVCW